MKQIYVVFRLARQLDGDGQTALTSYVGTLAERAFTDRNKAEKFASQQSKQVTIKIDTPQGRIECLCSEMAIHTVDLEE